MSDMRTQAVMGIIPPEVAEARMATRWPSVAAHPGPAKLGHSLQELGHTLFRWAIGLPTMIAAVLLVFVVPAAFLLALVAWVILAPVYFMKVLPLTATRYVLTNRRLMIVKGLKMRTSQEVSLDAIEEVRIVPGSEQSFYLAADLEILSNGKVALRLPGVPEYQQFKINIENAYLAWGRKSPPKEQIHPATELAGKK